MKGEKEHLFKPFLTLFAASTSGPYGTLPPSLSLYVKIKRQKKVVPKRGEKPACTERKVREQIRLRY